YEMTERWHTIYTPSDNIDSLIYATLLSSPSDDEWNATIAALPNGKAAGLSEISYEMLKHMDTGPSNFLKDIITDCFTSGHIPSQ
ncbi:MAG TPA: hypothetical protein VM660_05125, partial [Bacillus sp. (in: firmicutes)]|nr:hypothetical protein [Bacillus sp. (in: firmicutes)]